MDVGVYCIGRRKVDNIISFCGVECRLRVSMEISKGPSICAGGTTEAVCYLYRAVPNQGSWYQQLRVCSHAVAAILCQYQTGSTVRFQLFHIVFNSKSLYIFTIDARHQGVLFSFIIANLVVLLFVSLFFLFIHLLYLFIPCMVLALFLYEFILH